MTIVMLCILFVKINYIRKDTGMNYVFQSELTNNESNNFISFFSMCSAIIFKSVYFYDIMNKIISRNNTSYTFVYIITSAKYKFSTF